MADQIETLYLDWHEGEQGQKLALGIRLDEEEILLDPDGARKLRDLLSDHLRVWLKEKRDEHRMDA